MPRVERDIVADAIADTEDLITQRVQAVIGGTLADGCRASESAYNPITSPLLRAGTRKNASSNSTALEILEPSSLSAHKPRPVKHAVTC